MLGGTRNWPQTLRPASYKGAGFFVDEESLPKSGRFVAEHAFVKAESHSTEDMGRVPREFRLTAYLASDAADSDVRGFVELCSEAGPGTLVLPILGPVQARCRNCHVKAHKDRLGRVELELDFVEAGNADGGGFPAAPLGDRLAGAAVAQMGDTTSATIDSADEKLRQDAALKALGNGMIAAGIATPDEIDYQGNAADAAARNDTFTRLYGP